MGPDDRLRGQAYRHVPFERAGPGGPPGGMDPAHRWGGTVTRQRPMLVINPIADPAFVRACNEAMRAHPSHPDELQSMLRRAYPSVVVRPRSLSGELTTIWYVYRDGHWVSST